MYAPQLASGKQERARGLNNNYGSDPNKCVLPLRNWAKAFLPDIEIGTAPILGSILGGRTPTARSPDARPAVP
jgi:hypothetical protein